MILVSAFILVSVYIVLSFEFLHRSSIALIGAIAIIIAALAFGSIQAEESFEFIVGAVEFINQQHRSGPRAKELLGPLAPKLDPRLVAPVAAWLVHEDCPVTGEIYSVGGGRVARFFVGLTAGYVNPELTLEDVRDHFDLVRDQTGYTVPVGVAEEIGPLAQRLA